MLQPGQTHARYKDISLIAKIINKFDVLAATELLQITTTDMKHNKQLLNFLKNAPAKMKSLKSEITALNKNKNKKILLQTALMKLSADYKKAKDYYRKPGYLQILDELHKLKNGKEWALILTPYSQGAVKSTTRELIGYFYRSSRVKPRKNRYCDEVKKPSSFIQYACIPNFDGYILDQNYSDMISRKPFLAEFISGRFSYTLLASHTIFNSPKDPEHVQNYIERSFGVSQVKDLPKGVNDKNFARFGEVKASLKFMQALMTQGYSQQDIILLGDLNLENENPYWAKALQEFDNASLFIDTKTSLTVRRYKGRNQSETKGLSSKYDHFIFNPTNTRECIDKKTKSIKGGAFNFLEGQFNAEINKRYKVRLEQKQGNYYKRDNKKYYALAKEFIIPIQEGKSSFKTFGKKVITYKDQTYKSFGIINDHKKNDQYVDGFLRRILAEQLSDNTYYRLYKELISDHLPIYMECSTK